jgi:MFS family permease
MQKVWLNRTIIALGIVSLCSDLGSEMATAILPAFLVSLGSTAAILGIIEGFANASNSFMSILAGWASDYTTARKPFAVFGYFLAFLGIGCLSLAHSWRGVLGGRILTRMGKGVREPARDVLLVGATEPGWYGRVFGFHRMMDTLGAIIGPLLALVLIRLLPLHLIFIVACIPVLLACFIIIFAIQEVKTPHSKMIIRSEHMHHLSTSFKRYVMAVGIFGLGNCAVSLFILRSITLLNPSFGIARADWFSIFLYALFNIFYAFFSYPVGIVADWWGKKNVLLVGYVLTAIALLGFAFSYAQIWYCLLLFFIMGIATAIVDGVQRAIVADILPHQIQGTGFGILAGVAGIGNLLSSITVGFLWTTMSPFIGFGYAAVLCALGAVLMNRVK